MHTRLVNGYPVPNGCFVTLTYDDDHLPADGSLHVEHFQKFCKRLRNHLGPFRFLHCGEYGEQNGRPHYHALLFGLDFHEDREVFTQKGDQITWLSTTLSSIWSFGFTTLSPLTFATASYTAGYVVKKARDAQWRTWHDVYGANATVIASKKPEYITMSRKPGLGTSWFESYWQDVYPADRVRIAGATYRPPRFYDVLLERMDPVMYDQVISARVKFLEGRGPSSDNEIAARGADFSARLAMKKGRM
jgi:hypothetical protein